MRLFASQEREGKRHCWCDQFITGFYSNFYPYNELWLYEKHVSDKVCFRLQVATGFI